MEYGRTYREIGAVNGVEKNGERYWNISWRREERRERMEQYIEKGGTKREFESVNGEERNEERQIVAEQLMEKVERRKRWKK